MNFRLSTGLAAIVCMSLASCYPYNENSQKKKTKKRPDTTVTATPDELKIKAEEEAKQKAAEELKQQATAANTAGNPGNVTPSTDGPKPTETKRTDYPVANKVPGQENHVFSPYNNKKISTLDEQNRPIPSGTLVQDPTYPLSEKKFFRVP